MYISWNICRLIRLSDFRFYSQLKFFLQRSIWSLQVQSDFIKERKIDTIQQKKSKIHFCQSCKKELFVFIWVKRKEDGKEKRRAFCQVRTHYLQNRVNIRFLDLCTKVKPRCSELVRFAAIKSR